jgi:hypothetical protein
MPNYNLFIAEYGERLFILAENTDKKLAAAFYRSSGTCTPESKKYGEIFPILGILGEGKLGSDLLEFYKDSGRDTGWIVKRVSDSGRNDIKSYFGNEGLKKMSIRLEELLNDSINKDDSTYDILKISYEEFIAKLDEFYDNYGEGFYIRKMLNRANERKLVSKE